MGIGSGLRTTFATLAGVAAVATGVLVGLPVLFPVGSPQRVAVAPRTPSPPTAASPSPETVAAAPEAAPDVPTAPPPSFDTVRVAPDGSGLVAGRAEPGAQVQVLAGEEVAAEATADAEGRFVAFLELPASAEPRGLSLRDGAGGVSEETVILGPVSGPLPADAAGEEVAATPDARGLPLDEPGPELALADGAALPALDGAAEVASPAQPGSVAGAPAVAPGEAEPGAEAPAPGAAASAETPDASATEQSDPSREAADLAPGVPPGSDAAPEAEGAPVSEAVAAAPSEASEPAAGEDPTDLASAEPAVPPGPDASSGAGAVAPAPSASPDAASDLPAHSATGEDAPAVASAGTVAPPSPEAAPGAVPAPAVAEAPPPLAAPASEAPGQAAVLVSDAEGVRVLQPALAPGADAEILSTVALDAIAYDGSGEVVLSGRAREGGAVRLYLDNAPMAEAQVAPDGRWSATLTGAAPGDYTLRLDQIDAAGEVVSRIESPFRREEREDLAAAMAQSQAVGQGIVMRTVQPGNTLWAIARDRYGEPMMYVQVWEMNRDRIRDPDLIYPGQVFVLPATGGR